MLKELRWTPQVPIKRAIQRDEVAIRRWREEVWPDLQRRARRERRVLVFEDESGFYLLPEVVRTYAPQTRTPVLREMQTRDHLSVMGGMTPEGKVYTLVRQESLNGLDSIEFLLHLGRVAGRRLLMIWDGSPIHRRAEVQAFVADTRGAVCLEALPGYAPDLNPWDEGGAGITSRTWRCATWCAATWKNCTRSSTSRSVACARSRIESNPSLPRLD